MLTKRGDDILAAREAYVEDNGNEGMVGAAIGVPGVLCEGPQAFILEPHGETVIGPHFHRTDQFQLLIGGAARYGRHDARPPWAHFTDAYTTYGPIIPHPAADGPDGPVSTLGEDYHLSQFTVRIDADDQQLYMPESKPLKEQRSGRNLVAVTPDAARIDTPVAAGEVLVVPTIEPFDDGLAAHSVRAGVGAPFALPTSEGSRGAFWVVATGEIVVDGVGHGPRSIGFYTPDEELPPVHAGEDGATVIVLHFPGIADAAPVGVG